MTSKDERRIDSAIQMLKHNDEYVRITAIEVLLNMEGRKVLTQIKEILTDECLQIRKEVIVTLGRIGNHEILRDLLN